jgi:acyl carrier protein
MNNTIAQRIRGFVIENFLFGAPDNGLKDADSLLDKGIIDSTGVLELVTHLEATYGIKVDDEELVPENLDSIANIAAFVTRKQAA